MLAAHQAGLTLQSFSQEQTDKIVAAMAKAAEKEARRLALLAVEETGRGKPEDKTIKNLFAAVDIHNYIKKLKTCGVIAENKERKVVDIAVPVGVIAAIIPTTNPTSTAIFKILAAIKGRNSVVVSPHPQAVRCTAETARVMYEAALQAGAPEGCVNCMDVVTLEGTTELMRHRLTGLILATGGPGLVRAAYSSGKPAFGVGPGNVPAFVERSADIPKAVRDILTGKTFDNGLLCSSEQALVCDKPVESQVLRELQRNGAHLLAAEEQTKLEQLIQTPDKKLNAAIAGKSPQVIAEMAGFSVPSHAICLVGRPGGVGKEHPLSMEKLSPILAFFVEDGWKAGCERCIEILRFGGLGHTMAIHSNDRRVVMEFGLHKPANRICVNTPATHGSIGLTTGVPPSMTLGCGSPGGNITSDNITPLHLINIRRLAYETRPADTITYEALGPTPPATPGRPLEGIASSRGGIDSSSIRKLVRNVVEDYLNQKPPLSTPDRRPPSTTPAPSAAKGVETVPTSRQPAVDFVCEDDVRQALDRKQKIVVNARTIITPSARELGEGRSVFLWE